MKTSPFWRGLALLLVVGLVLPAFLVGDAQADRRSGLMGNHFIKDADDAKALPQDAVLYRGRLSVDYMNSPDADGGEAALYVGDAGLTWHWRGSDEGTFSPLANFAAGSTIYSPENVLSDFDIAGNTALDPFNMQFVTFGVSSGDNVSRWGVNLNVGLDKSETKATGGDVSQSASLFNLIFGYSMENIDLAGEFTLGSNNSEDTDPAAPFNLDGSLTAFTLFGRGVAPDMWFGEDFYWAGAFAYAKSTTDMFFTATDIGEDEVSGMAFMAEFGRVYTANDLTVAAGFMFDYQKLNDNPAEQTGTATDFEDDFTDIVLPGCNVAVEYALTDRLTLRGGVKSRYVWDKEEDEAGTEVTTRSYSFDWVLGMGYTRGMAEVNVVIDPNWVETGSFLGSQSEDMFGAVEITWNWGE